ncbi:MAG: UTP--glucose-1-phosphate uridylyltransferase [Pseudomonadota bacterium]
MRIRKALIPAAGLGTRFLPATKVVPKELLPIVDRPALEYIVEELADSGIEEIVLVIHPDKQIIAEHFRVGGNLEEALKKRGQIDRLAIHHRLLKRVSFTIAYQKEPLGLGHAVLCGRDAIEGEPFAVVLPDDLVRSKVPCLKQLIDVYNHEKLSVVAVEDVPREEVRSYGIVEPGKKVGLNAFRVEKIVEKPAVDQAPSNWGVIGRYVLDPAVFPALEKLRPGAIGEIQLTDALAVLAREKGLIGLPFEGTRIDAGRCEGYIAANLLYGFDNPTVAAKLRPILKTLLK